ncbi:uncharacterized protein TNCV_2944241 [Trichonephila clavipes]|nr:uncharacterized protein TNCV_2944241 [Trichonephila clavipes]
MLCAFSSRREQYEWEKLIFVLELIPVFVLFYPGDGLADTLNSSPKGFRSASRAVGSLVVRASDSRPEGLGSMLDVTKYPPSAHGFTCRNCGGGDRGRVAIYRPFGEVSLSLNRTVTCMVLKVNDRRTSCPCHDEFRGPRSDYVRQVALATTTTDLHLTLPEVILFSN